MLRLRTQALHGVEHVLLLGQEGIAELLRPLELVGHRLQHLGKGDQRLHADVPGLGLDRLDRCVALDVRIGLYPARGIDDLERISGGHQHLGEHRIGVQGDWRDERLDLLGFEGGGHRGRGRRLRRWRRRGPGRGRLRRRGRGSGLGRRVGLRRRRCRNLHARAQNTQGSGDERRSYAQRRPLDERLHAHPFTSDRRVGAVHVRYLGIHKGARGHRCRTPHVVSQAGHNGLPERKYRYRSASAGARERPSLCVLTRLGAGGDGSERPSRR